MKPIKRHDEQGAALIIAVVLMAILGLFATAYWSQLHSTLAAARAHAKAQKTHVLAESGVERALAELRAGNQGIGAPQVHVLGDGAYRVALTPQDNGAFLITSTGFLGEVAHPLHETTVKAEVRPTAGAAFAQIHYLPERH